MRILITGATGFLGSHLSTTLIESNYVVAALVRSPRKVKDSRIIVFRYENNLSTVITSMKEFSPDLVIHLGALFLSSHSPDDVKPLVEANVVFGSYVLEAMSISGVKRLINAGTSWQHYNNDEYNPVNLYAATKQAYESLCEYYVQVSGFSILNLHLFDSYGPNDSRRKIIDLLLQAALTDSELNMSPGKQKLVLLHIDDIVNAFMRSIHLIRKKKFENKVYMVRGRKAVSLRQLVHIIENVIGKKIRVNFGARPYRDREIMRPWSNGEKLPGWKPEVTLQNGISRLYKEFECSDS